MLKTNGEKLKARRKKEEKVRKMKREMRRRKWVGKREKKKKAVGVSLEKIRKGSDLYEETSR